MHPSLFCQLVPLGLTDRWGKGGGRGREPGGPPAASTPSADSAPAEAASPRDGVGKAKAPAPIPLVDLANEPSASPHAHYQSIPFSNPHHSNQASAPVNYPLASHCAAYACSYRLDTNVVSFWVHGNVNDGLYKSQTCPAIPLPSHSCTICVDAHVAPTTLQPRVIRGHLTGHWASARG